MRPPFQRPLWYAPDMEPTEIQPPVLYSFRRCPYAMRARVALAISGLAVEMREIKLSAKPDELTAASPKGTVPVMVLPNGEVLEQSLDIMKFALAQNDPDGWLKYIDSDLILQNDTSFKNDLDRYKYPDRHGSDILAHRAAGIDFLSQLERRLTQASNLCGDTLGFTDAAIAPFVRQFAAVDREWFQQQPLPNLQRWLQNFEQSDLFSAIMLRVNPWEKDQVPLVTAWS